MKQLPIFLLLLFPLFLFSQERNRVEIFGKITAPVGEDLEEINVYNKSSLQGTVTNEKGEFRIGVGENDRVQITALQYKSFTIIITAEDIEKKKLLVYLNPFVNHLEEVTVRSTDLTGYAGLDAKKIKTSVFVPEWDLSYATLEFGYRFQRGGQTEIDGNAAEEALGMHNIPMASIDLFKLVELFFPNKTPSSTFVTVKRISVDALVKKYGHEYIAETFQIPSENVNDFVYFVQDNGLTVAMMKSENEMKLLKYLFDQSELYRKQISSQN